MHTSIVKGAMWRSVSPSVKCNYDCSEMRWNPRLAGLFGTGISLAERNPSLQRRFDYVPVGLSPGHCHQARVVVGWSSNFSGGSNNRVLVRDLQYETLDSFGTGMPYCYFLTTIIPSLAFLRLLPGNERRKFRNQRKPMPNV